jgi:hypothetical protein
MNRAEALICRAYGHFMLLSLYSNMFDNQGPDNQPRWTELPGIPYVEEVEDNVFKQYDRGTIAQTISKIERDILASLEAIGGSADYEVPQFRFTYRAAVAFAVRFYLFTRNYAKVIQYSNILLPSANTFEYTGNQNPGNDGTPERYVSENDQAYKELGSTLMNWREYKSSGTNLYVPGQFFSNPSNSSFLLSSEVRSLLFRTFLGTLFTHFAYNLDLVSKTVSSNPTGGAWALQALSYQNDQTAFWVKYYEDFLYVNEAAGIGYAYYKVNLLRLEEVLLSRAEAKIMLAMNNSDKAMYDSAIDDLNMYAASKIDGYVYANHRLNRTRIINYYTQTSGKWADPEAFVFSTMNENIAFSTVSGQEETLARTLIYCVMDFRRVEFMFEGMRYFDILRWNIPVTHTRLIDNMSRTLYPTDDNRVLQIPESAVLAGIEFNPMETIEQPWPNVRYKY